MMGFIGFLMVIEWDLSRVEWLLNGDLMGL
jgi:hypothetical protein